MKTHLQNKVKISYVGQRSIGEIIKFHAEHWKNEALVGCIMPKLHPLAPFFQVILCQAYQALSNELSKIMATFCYETW